MKNSSVHATYARRRALLVLTVLLLVFAFFAFRNVGHWLTRQDPLEHADAIVVLSGGLPYRAEAAAEIYKAGYAPELWVTHPTGPQESLATLGIHFMGEEEYDRQILTHQGVPEDNVTILPNIIINTEDEVAEIARETRRRGKHTVIIVTSPEHTRRVRALWHSIVGSEPRAIVRAASGDPFDPDHWWRHTQDSLSVVRELLGLLNVWLGLPVRPRT